jgi:hypothetical protein
MPGYEVFLIDSRTLYSGSFKKYIINIKHVEQKYTDCCGTNPANFTDR